MLNRAPRGTVDIFGDEMLTWHYVENIIRSTAKKYAIDEIRTPIFEYTELFIRGMGEVLVWKSITNGLDDLKEGHDRGRRKSEHTERVGKTRNKG